jgi:hypothetical protein
LPRYGICLQSSRDANSEYFTQVLAIFQRPIF